LNTRKGRKLTFLFYSLGAILSGYLGYLVGGIYYQGMTLYEFIPAFEKVLEKPLALYWSRDSPKMILLFVCIYLIAIFMYLSSRVELMAGKEHGTARLADARRVSKLTEDKEPKENMIISQNVKLSMDNQKLKLNSNMLVIGGSGAGKSFHVVTPNALNLPNASLIFTDPKGGARRSSLKRTGTSQLNNYFNLIMKTVRAGELNT